MTSAYIFCGPSLEKSYIENAIALTGAQIFLLPPARQGDILRILRRKPSIIGLIDGFFFQQPAVHFKEILLALDSGIAVLGAASMGALRAAELSIYGMEGVGEIYRMYADGRVDGDDEVAILHAGPDDNYRTMSEALVNVRANVSRAQQSGILDRHSARAIVKAAQNIHFTERTFDAVFLKLASSSINARYAITLRSFREFLDKNYIDQKREDSIILVDTLARRLKTISTPSHGTSVRTPRTSYLMAFERTYIGRSYGDADIADYRIWSLKKLLAPGFEAIWRQHSVRCLAIDEARHRGFRAPSEQTLLGAFREDRGLVTAQKFNCWLEDNSMNTADLSLWLQECWLEAEFKRWHMDQMKEDLAGDSYADWLIRTVGDRLSVRPDLVLDRVVVRPGLTWEEPMLREEKATGAFSKSAEVACEVFAYNKRIEREAPGVISRLGATGLENWFASRWGRRAEEISAAVRRRGFNSISEFHDIARIGFLFDALDAKPLHPPK